MKSRPNVRIWTIQILLVIASVFGFTNPTVSIAAVPLGTTAVIDQAVLNRATNPQQPIPVIISLQMPFGHYYEAGQSAARTAQKQQQFMGARNQLQALLGKDGTAGADLKLINAVAATITAPALHALEHSPLVKKVELDGEVRATLDSSVPDIHATEVWPLLDSNNQTVTGLGVTVAVLDTGIDYTHPDLGGCFGPSCKVIGGYDFINSDSDPRDDNGHGTHVAGIVAANGVVKGVAPDAKLLAYKVCSNSAVCDAAKIVAALDYTVDPNRDGNPSDHADIAQMSLNGTGNPDDAMSTAVDNATALGVTAVVAAGNFGPLSGSIQSPGNARTAITVGAYCEAFLVGVDSACANAIASFSSRGPLIWNGENLHKPDVVAPGVQICSTKSTPYFYPNDTNCIDSRHVLVSGTSMATPHVSGAAALIKQVYPNYTPSQIKQLLKVTADNLSLSEDDQGAGKINVHKALPLDSSLSSSPVSWEAVSDPTGESTQLNQTFTITPTGNSSSASLAASLTAPGITLSIDKNSLDFSSGSDAFQATVTIDNTVAKNGGYGGSVTVTESPSNQRIIPIFVTVQGTFSASPTTTLDYGIDLPSLSSWTSDPQTITLTNHRTDIAQTASVSLGGFPSGVSLDAPTTVNIPAGDSAQFDARLVINNNNTVGNGVYQGFINISTATTAYKLNVKFVKNYILTINDANGTDLLGAKIWIHDHNSLTQTITVDSVPMPIYLNFSGTYDVVVMYNPVTDQSGEHRYTVVKEGIVISAANTNVSVSRSDASHKVKLAATDSNGNAVTPLHDYDAALIYLPNTDRNYITNVTSSSDVSENYISDLSTDYGYQTFYNVPGTQPASTLSFYYGGFTGLSADQTFTNTAADLHQVQLKIDNNRGSGIAEPVVMRCWAPPLNASCSFKDDPNTTLTLPITQTIYSNAPAGTYIKHFSDKLRTGCSAGVCNFIFASPLIDLNTGARKTNQGTGNDLPALAGNTQYTGLGPSVWNVKFDNLATQVRLKPYIPGVNAAFVRQDYAYQEYAVVPYQLFRNNSLLSSGNINSFSISVINPFNTGNTLPSPNLSTGGSTEFRTSLNYQNQGQALSAQVSALFDTTLSDPNPPAFKRLNYFTGANRSDVHDSAATNHVEFELDPIGGTLGTVTAQVSSDGTTFNSLTLGQNNGVYSATPPGVAGSKIYLRIIASDDSGNQLTYTFQLPNINPVPDTTAPTVSITAPSNNANVSGSAVTVAATASDDVGVAGVQFKLDGNNLGSEDTTSPYSTTWNTTQTSNGSHTLTAVARDAAGNTTTSSSITVTVNNDTTAPSTSITSPSDNQIVKGTINVTANATDDVAVTKVELYRNGTLVDTDTTSPYSFSWNTTTVGDASYQLQTKAYDGANNIGNSGIVNVIVDNTNPTATVTSPSNNASVSGNVNITADAADANGISQVEFFRDSNVSLGTDNTAPYSLSWNSASVAAGSHTLYVKATDSVGNVVTSSAISITVLDTTAPTVSITAPSNGATVSGNAVTVSATASDDVGVAGVQFKLDGTNLGSENITAPYSISWDSTAATNGNHTLTAVARDAAGNTTTATSITVTVSNDVTAPTTSITSPTNNQTINGTISVTANASDNVGVTKVELYRNGTLVDTDFTAPYSFSWDTTTVGDAVYQLQTKAYDAANNFGSSTIINATVDNNAPTSALTAPADNATVSGSAVTVSADATDAIGVTQVEFYRDGNVLIGTDTTAPYSITWNTTAVTTGSHTLTAKAYDAAGHTTTSVTRTVTVQDVTAPVTAITSPTNGGTVVKKTTVTIQATATDFIGVSRVEFYVNNVLKCTDTTSPYTCAWTVPNGAGITYQLQTKAFDAANNMGVSAIVSVISQ